jgi:hypothetical protein
VGFFLIAHNGRGAACGLFLIAHNGLASARQKGRVPRLLVPGLRGLCAFFESRTTDSLRPLGFFKSRTTDAARPVRFF